MELADIRKDYRLRALDEADASPDPLAFFQRWLDEAAAAQVHEHTAMTLATAGPDGRPHARIVLLKGADAQGLSFFTNYESDKGRQLDAVPHAALLFFWPELERQVRVEGRVARLSPEESDAYFAIRPPGSQIGAWASPQSRKIESRHALEDLEHQCEARFAGSAPPRPPHWGGFSVKPSRWEFWQGRPSRLHDRLLYEQEENLWQRSRLAP